MARKKNKKKRKRTPREAAPEGAHAPRASDVDPDEGVGGASTDLEASAVRGTSPDHDREAELARETTESPATTESPVMDSNPVPDDEIEVVDISLDDDLDDPEARERLIAEALALAATEDELDSTEGNDTADEDVVGVAERATIAGEGEPVTDLGGDDETPVTIPAITPGALAALTAIHHEGIAKAPGEIILDLGEGSSPEERDRLLAAALAHAEMREAIYRVPLETGRARRWKGTIGSAIFVVAMLIALRPPGLLVPAAPAVVSDADRLYGVRVALLVQAQQVEAFRVREQRLPESLGELPTPLPDMRLVRSGNRIYQLVARLPDGRAVIYDSAIPAADFEPVSRRWATTADGS